ncbi:hypothetical protein FRB93_009410 [Tulasnella sp. JGI-2019a]|nr:hypothetical protein FRB93_009410 [Tulasnella sp. JGI-2019a]
MLLGRLAMELRMGQYLLVKPEKLTKYFLSSDIGTFLFQAAGASMVTSTDQSRRNSGVKAFIIGMILQLASFCMFIALFVIWNHRVYKQEPSVWLRDKMTGRPWYQDWRTFSAAIFISCIMILIRSAFRVAEASEGGQGHLMTTESYFYCLDCFPLLISIIVYVPIWPGSFISGNPYSTSDEESYQMKARQPPKTY